MHICVIGAGAMGAIYGGMLARAGETVTLIDTWPEHVQGMAAEGLRLDGIGGDLRIPVTVLSEAPSEAFADVALIQVDTNATAAAAETAARILKPDGFAVTLQNGVGNVETLCAALGQARVAGGLTYHSGAVRGPGHVSHTNAGPTWLGELDGSRSARIERLAEILSGAGFKPSIVDNILGYIWTKFVHNCAINPVCAATGLRVGEILGNAGADALQSRLIEEAVAVVRAKGIALADADPMATIKAFCKLKYNKPSMLQHVEAGKRTEIDSLNGAVVREGAALGIATPYSQAIVWVIKGLEAARAQALHGDPIDYAALEAAAQARASERAKAS